MPSLPTKNSAPECVYDSYRRYLPPSYRYSFELYIINSFTNVFIAYLRFVASCTIFVLLFFGVTFGFTYLGNYIDDDRQFRQEGFTFLHDLYWFILLSLYCFCFTLICYRKIPREHIHVRIIMNPFSRNWNISLYITSLILSLIAFVLHYLLNVLEWNKHQISSSKSLDHLLTHWNIYCNIFICEDWTLSRFYSYIIAPPITLFFNCFLLHYWLFGFHKDGYFDRFKLQQNRHKSFKKSLKKQMSVPQSRDFSHNLESNSQRLSNGGMNGIHCSISVHTQSNSLNASNGYLGINDIPHLSIDSIEEPMDGININNNSMSPIFDNNHRYKRKNTNNNSKLASDLTGISTNTFSTRSSPYNSLLNKSFMGFRYPESKMLKWISLFCLTQMLVNATFMTLSNVKNKWYKKYFVWIFLFILITTSILKWMMKRISRMIDASRGTIPANWNKSRVKTTRNGIGSKSKTSHHDPLSNVITDQLQNQSNRIRTYISLELCTELYMDFVFFLAYRELMMYNVVPDVTEFFKVSIYFFVHEIWMCSLRPSSTYYTLTSYIQNWKCVQKLISCILCNNLRDGKNHNYDDERSDLSANTHSDDIYRSVDPMQLKKRLLFFNWRDDSTLIQWQIRCSLDITMRILAGVISSFMIIIQVLILGPAHFNLEKKDWIIGMEYIGLSASIHLGYFALVYIWNFKVMAFPLLEPWWSLTQNSNQRTWKFVCVALMIISFWLPDL